MTRETHARADTTKSPEEVRKFTDRVEKCTQEAEKVTEPSSLISMFIYDSYRDHKSS